MNRLNQERKPFGESQYQNIQVTPTKYEPKIINDKENEFKRSDDPYVKFVSNSVKKYDYGGTLQHEDDSWKPF
jgi:hypothetical protein